MLIIGCDFHTRYQQIAMAEETTGELLLERRLDHESGEAQAFYRNFHGPVRVGIEATGPLHWFERLLTELGHELWIGDSAKIRPSEVRKQKTDERDARLILGLLLAKRFPKIWVPTPAERDLRQWPWHRLRTTLGNRLHALAMSQGLCRKKKLFSKKGRVELVSLGLAPWARRRREELLKLLDQVDPQIAELDRAVLEEACIQRTPCLLMLILSLIESYRLQPPHPLSPVESYRFENIGGGGIFNLQSANLCSSFRAIPFVFTFFRTLFTFLRPTKTQLFSFHANPHSASKNVQHGIPLAISPPGSK